MAYRVTISKCMVEEKPIEYLSVCMGATFFLLINYSEREIVCTSGIKFYPNAAFWRIAYH